jgi:hypothetical protein
MFKIDVRSNIKTLSREFDALAQKQVPFATAKALNAVGKRIQGGEEDNFLDKFKNPTPFTRKSVGFSRATKAEPTVTVYVKDIAARYLQPYEDGGKHFLNSRALLNPKDIKLNAYGQLPKATLARLKARPDIFIGIVKTKAGPVNGVWQRVTDTSRVTLLGANGKRLRGLNKGPTARLKLLIRFGDALPVKQRLDFGGTAAKIVAVHIEPEFEAAMAQALATAR